MAKTCKSKGCNRKTASETVRMCPPCTNAYESASSEVLTSESPCSREPPTLDLNQLYETYNSFSSQDSIIKDMYAMLLNIALEKIEDQVKENSYRLDPDELAVPRSLAVRNLPLPGNGITDYELVKQTFAKIGAPDVNVETDIVCVVRKGANAPGKLGTVMVEMVTDQACGPQKNQTR